MRRRPRGARRLSVQRADRRHCGRRASPQALLRRDVQAFVGAIGRTAGGDSGRRHRLQTPSRTVAALPLNLMHPLSCKPITSVPKLANRTPFAVVIDSFLVRTANYAIGDCDGSHLMLSDKFKHLAGNVWIGTDVATIHFPVA